MNQHRPTWLYWPNIIDYGRIVCFVLFLLSAMHHAIIACSAFVVLALADAVDGWLARSLDQQSALGTALDFTIDRVVTASLLLVLAILYNPDWLWFCVFLALDTGSHFMHLYRTAIIGDGHHKHNYTPKNKLLSVYYNKRSILFILCFFHDAWLITLYLYHFYTAQWLFVLLIFLFPGFMVKTIIHGLQFLDASQTLCQPPSTET